MPNIAKACTDPIVGAILSGWRYDISSISPEMRTDYENHLVECRHCVRAQRRARTIDVLLLLAFSLLIVAFLLTTVLMHRVDLLQSIPAKDIPPAVQSMLTRSIPFTISLQVVDLAGLAVSIVLWLLVAMATPVPGLVAKRIERMSRRHA